MRELSSNGGNSSSSNYSIFKQIKNPYILYFIYGVILIVSCIRLTPWNRLGSLTVVGNEQLDSQQIIQWSELTPLHPKRATFKQVKSIEDRLKEKTPLVETIQLLKEDPFHTQIIVEETKIIGQVAVDNQTYVVSRQGAYIEEENSSLPHLLFDEEDGRLNEFLTSLGQIDSDLIEQFEYIQLTPTHLKTAPVKIQCNNGDLIVTNIQDLPNKLSLYDQMKEQVNQAQGVYHLDVGAYFSPTVHPEDQLELL